MVLADRDADQNPAMALPVSVPAKADKCHPFAKISVIGLRVLLVCYYSVNRLAKAAYTIHVY